MTRIWPAFMLATLTAGLSLCAAQDAPERATTIVAQLKGDAFNDCYTGGSGGARLLTNGGRVPIAEIAGQRALKFEIDGRGGDWYAGLARPGWVRWYLDDYVPAGVLEFSVCGAKGGERFRIGLADSDKDGPGRSDKELSAAVPVSKYVTIQQQWQTVRVPLSDLLIIQPNLDFSDCIKLLISNDGAPAAMTFYLRELRFTTRSPEHSISPIKLDQLGYRPDAQKIAKISAQLTAFRIVNTETKETVFTGEAKRVATNDPVSGDSVWDADFSALTAPGKYNLEAEGLEASAPFEIRADIYDNLFRDSARFYYLQRCGAELDEKHAGQWARAACHLGDAKALTRDGKDARDVTGGWHDAGDMNKYPPWVRFPIFMMLDLYDVRHDVATDGSLNIPESGNGIPDILDNAQWELDWLLKMQITDGAQAGAIYDRIHQSVAPKAAHERLQEERRLVPPSDEATAVCASVWARAARTFGQIPERKGQAARYLAAAELAWKRLEANNAKPEFRLTAAASLFDATGEAKYRDITAALMTQLLGNPKESSTEKLLWAVYDCSIAELANSDRDGGGLRERARAYLKAYADTAVKAWQKDAYAVPLWNAGHYCWSSNLHICKMGYMALMVNRYSPREEYSRMAEDNLHYLLGRNAVGMSLVSGYGARSTEIYHTIFGGSSTAWQPLPPGIIGGGVNQWESRGISVWPSKNYRSDPNNWTLTEPAIYYNAPLVFLAGYFAGKM